MIWEIVNVLFLSMLAFGGIGVECILRRVVHG